MKLHTRRSARKTKLVYNNNIEDVLKFMADYPTVRSHMERFCCSNVILQDYIQFISWLNPTGYPLMGGTSTRVSSPHFGTKTFWQYNFHGSIGWANVFQYVWDQKFSGGKK
jgi:hypothetical protein